MLYNNQTIVECSGKFIVSFFVTSNGEESRKYYHILWYHIEIMNFYFNVDHCQQMARLVLEINNNRNHNGQVCTMTRNRTRINRAAVSVRKQTLTRATAGEVMALTIMGGLAFISMAIGTWSTLTFFRVMAGEGPVGIISGFMQF